MIDNLIGRVVLSGENEITDDKGEKLYSLLDCDGSVLDVGRYPVLGGKLPKELEQANIVFERNLPLAEGNFVVFLDQSEVGLTNTATGISYIKLSDENPEWIPITELAGRKLKWQISNNQESWVSKGYNYFPLEDGILRTTDGENYEVLPSPRVEKFGLGENDIEATFLIVKDTSGNVFSSIDLGNTWNNIDNISNIYGFGSTSGDVFAGTGGAKPPKVIKQGVGVVFTQGNLRQTNQGLVYTSNGKIYGTHSSSNNRIYELAALSWIDTGKNLGGFTFRLMKNKGDIVWLFQSYKSSTESAIYYSNDGINFKSIIFNKVFDAQLMVSNNYELLWGMSRNNLSLIKQYRIDNFAEKVNLPNIPDPTNGGITGKYKIIADK